MSDSARLGSDDKNNNREQMKTDRRIETRDGWVGGVEIIPIINEKAFVIMKPPG